MQIKPTKSGRKRTPCFFDEYEFISTLLSFKEECDNSLKNVKASTPRSIHVGYLKGKRDAYDQLLGKFVGGEFHFSEESEEKYE